MEDGRSGGGVVYIKMCLTINIILCDDDDDEVFCPKAGLGDGTFVPPIRLPYEMSTGGMAGSILCR